MILVDRKIREWVYERGLVIAPFETSSLQPASYEVHLLDEFFDVSREQRFKQPRWNLLPDQFILGSTIEALRVPPNLVVELTGCSTEGRQGLLVHATAGHIDPGFVGQVTLELKNIGPKSIPLEAGMRIGQLVFTVTEGEAENPYGSRLRPGRYQFQQGPTPPRDHHAE